MNFFPQINVSNTSMEFSAQNARRLLRSLLPPPTVELSQMCQQGFDDALVFLLQNDLISCEECSLIQMNVVTSLCNDDDDLDPECDR
jgi:patatin-like phospholipase domain-containing protein 2